MRLIACKGIDDTGREGETRHRGESHARNRSPNLRFCQRTRQ
jgi:hypothetical protein